jgi:hypothetical protein
MKYYKSHLLARVMRYLAKALLEPDEFEKRTESKAFSKRTPNRQCL